eukprot:Protomagalhaensia_sp_Gyna_25__4943@NODE_533_length_3189_cov_185_222222_g417_i0_p1_GENE_NODE_533_length_3189_cov_185_222222_g417_i0NODE_533_length_3189_cov_185_222222_g417_i0_p1_ORF_typecomplete_len292_score43_83tRNA_m1G_MT/PF01746_21/5e03tRNA_m1G_MT/PF01746_21/1_4e11RNA_Me_trans/PF04252_13/2_6e06Phage_Nu1/PF07471_12/0_32_NODE_533_length_3189_cov_185_222222_g417_i021473022
MDLLDLADLAAETTPSTKDRLHTSDKRQAKLEKLRAARKHKRRNATARRRNGEREARKQLLDSMTTEERIVYIREERYYQENQNEILRRKLLQAREEATLHICINLDFNERMSAKELRSLASQLGYVFKSVWKNEHYKVSIDITSFTTQFVNDCQFYGYSRWNSLTSEDHVLELHRDRKSDMIVLSPDADTLLKDEEIRDSSKIFIIGGLVDRTVCKGETRSFALRNELESRRLPIRESLGSTVHPVLNINSVADILMAVHCDQLSLLEAFLKLIPQRKQRHHNESQTGFQ